MSRSPTFCILPWVHLATNSSGSLRVCCNSTPAENILKKEDGTPFRLNQDTLEDAWNSKLMQQTRHEMLNGQKPAICQRCFTEESAGVESARIKWNQRWSSPQENSERPALLPKYVDLRLGNLCNLKCRMCNPYASSKWVNEWNKVSDSAKLVPAFKLSDQEAKRLSHMTWMEDETTWRNMHSIIDQVEEIYLTGGEPTLIQQQTLFLQRLVADGVAPRLVLKYNTNLTTVSQTLIELWRNFKKVKLNVSIDGFGALNEYIRHPSRWSVIEKNLATVHALQGTGQALQVNVHTTVQAYNILHLCELFEFLQTRFGIFPYLNILNHPDCLNIRVLPPALKTLAADRLRPYVNEPKVREVLSYLSQSGAPQGFTEFKAFSARCDQERGESLLKLCPEFSDFW